MINLDFIKFDTTEEKIQWGGIIGGAGLTLVLTTLCCVIKCREFRHKRKERRAIKALAKEKAEQTVLCIEPSAPPAYESAQLMTEVHDKL
jgi:hypothetical protein